MSYIRVMSRFLLVAAVEPRACKIKNGLSVFEREENLLQWYDTLNRQESCCKFRIYTCKNFSEVPAWHLKEKPEFT